MTDNNELMEKLQDQQIINITPPLLNVKNLEMSEAMVKLQDPQYMDRVHRLFDNLMKDPDNPKTVPDILEYFKSDNFQNKIQDFMNRSKTGNGKL